MSKKHLKTWLVAWGLSFVLASYALAQVPSAYPATQEPFPRGFHPFGDTSYEPFDFPDVSQYGSGPPAEEGFFINFDLLQWTVEAPDGTTVGAPGLTNPSVIDPGEPGVFSRPLVGRSQSNSLTLAAFDTEWTQGGQTEFGWVYGNHGWVVRAYEVDSANHRLTATDVDVVFQDFPGGNGIFFLDGFTDLNGDAVDDDNDADDVYGRDGADNSAPPDGAPDVLADTDFGDLFRLAVVFDDMSIRQKTDIWAAELMHIWRFGFGQKRWLWEFSGGVRYMEMDDKFKVTAEGGVLDDSNWFGQAQNNIVGPQVAARLARKWGRWGLGTEGRFVAGWNFQSMNVGGTLGTNIIPGARNQPYLFGGSSFNYTAHEEEFSPVVELRIIGSYQLTRALSLRAGWQGTYIDNIARGSGIIEYRLPAMGILTGGNEQDIFYQGLTFGFSWNR
jgi:hypothetical protein